VRWIIVVAVVAALALARTVSFVTSFTTCVTDYTYNLTWRDSPKPGEPPSSTSERCSRYFWWS
jgi:hypothetical protein